MEGEGHGGEEQTRKRSATHHTLLSDCRKCGESIGESAPPGRILGIEYFVQDLAGCDRSVRLSFVRRIANEAVFYLYVFIAIGT